MAYGLKGRANTSLSALRENGFRSMPEHRWRTGHE